MPWRQAQPLWDSRCLPAAVGEEASVEGTQLGFQLAPDSLQVGMKGDKGHNRSLGQPDPVARDDQLMAFLASSPVADALPSDAARNVATEAPRRMPPFGIGRGAEIA
ncbi:MAG: hypothetical protein ABL962_13270 [Fimbriimonadaceae bacterium]